jgi:hypothetical protein
VDERNRRGCYFTFQIKNNDVIFRIERG